MLSSCDANVCENSLSVGCKASKSFELLRDLSDSQALLHGNRYIFGWPSTAVSVA
jgi:hypothetical protein